MADALVRELNRLGYQPVFLPRTNVEPPEIYAYSRPNKRLVRYGALREYLNGSPAIKLNGGNLGDIKYTYTSSKRVSAAVSFLENALKCIGISGTPKIDLSFTGAEEFGFSLTDVTYRSFDPAQLGRVLSDFTPRSIPSELVEQGHLHVAYEYAYAKELLMGRADKQSFATNIGANLAQYVNVGVEGEVSVASNSTISFKNKRGLSAAFAYKAGKLVREGRNWVLAAEEISVGGALEERIAYVPQRAVVLVVDERDG
jgi:hypothetical protein